MTNLATALTERLIESAVYSETAQGVYVAPARHELALATAAVVAAIENPWHPIENPPIDEWILLADSGGYVSQAIYGEDEENPRWRLANGQYLHANFEPLAWMPMPEYPGSQKVSHWAVDIFRSALLDIKSAHVPDQPASSQADETTWVMQHVGAIRRIASKALDEASQLYSFRQQAITDENGMAGQWQDDLDYWAKKNLPSETAGCITAWSDHIAQFIVWRLQERTRR